MRAAIMQPYFFPYIGYFQLIAAADLFIVYDNIKYTKKGWINRNRILQNGTDSSFALPLKSGSDSLDVCQREVSPDFHGAKLLNRIRGAYAKAPFFNSTFPLIEEILCFKNANLFEFLYNSILRTCSHIGITTKIIISSSIMIDHGLKGQEKVIALCKAVGANTYINSIGGFDLYSKDAFWHSNILLNFIKSRPFEYSQLGNDFIPWLSIIDVMMFNPVSAVRDCVTSNYELI